MSTLTLCQPTTISWSSGTPPFLFWAANEDNSDRESYSDISGYSYTYTPDMGDTGPNGLQILVEDAGNNIVYDEVYPVQVGADTSCVQTSGGSSPNSSTPSPTNSNDSAGSTESSGSTQTLSQSSPPTSPTAPASSADSSGGGGSTDRGTIIGAVVGGVFGLVGAIGGAIILARCTKRSH